MKKLTVTALVNSHANKEGLACILNNLLDQTRPPDEIIIHGSGYEDSSEVWVTRYPKDTRIDYFPHPTMNDWGHDMRAAGLAKAKSDVVGFFNDDDSYSTEYLARMMFEMERGADVAFCAWNAIPHCQFTSGSSTAGNFLIRRKLARRIGWKGRHYEADGEFIDRVRHSKPEPIIVRIDTILYHHNVQ